MSLLSPVARKNAGGRWLLAGIYLLLVLGALSILYPFALMLALSVSNRLDYDRFRLIPLAFGSHESRFVSFLGDRYANFDWTIFQAAYGAAAGSYWSDLVEDPVTFLKQSNLHRPPDVEKLKRYEEFLAGLPPDWVTWAHRARVELRYDEALAKIQADAMKSAQPPVDLSPRLPGDALWIVQPLPTDHPSIQWLLEFRRSSPPEELLPIPGRAIWLNWIHNTIGVAGANEVMGTQYREALDVPFLAEGLAERFRKEALPARYGGVTPEELYARWIGAESAWVDLPMAEYDYWLFSRNPAGAFFESLTSNYRLVWRYLVGKGRAVNNTVILILLSVLTALIINPLAAYALSRYRLRGTPMILLFLLASSAFPAEVSMIPSFLLLRDLGLLNTFAALVLPGAANGFMIFLLKGFFDSLPRELYEAADVDGAGELRKLFVITLPMSAPILAIMTLNTFLAAFTGYMWAFLVCQDPNIWTLMVWLFQFQMEQPPWVAMAAVVLASIPTLAVFSLCQRVILRGIVIPEMK